MIRPTVGDIVQLSPVKRVPVDLRGALMVVTAVDFKGVDGVIHGLGDGHAYYKADHRDYWRVGQAVYRHPSWWARETDDEDKQRVKKTASR